MDEIVFLCMEFFEAKGAKFIVNSGKAVQVTYKNDNDWYWYSEYPYKLHHSQKWRSEDFFSEITKLKEHKRLWGLYCDSEMTYLLKTDDKSCYQIKVCTQDLDYHSADVKNFLDNYKILKIKSPMATRKSNIIDEVVKQSKDKNRILFITNRVSLSKDIAAKYSKYGVKHYQSSQINDHYDQAYSAGDSLVVQFDSLYKYNCEDFDVVILDEVSSLILYMTDTYEGKEKIYIKNINKFYSLRDKQFVISDAFIINFPFEGKTLGIYNEFRESLNVTEYQDLKIFNFKIQQVLKNGLISISSNEKRFLVTLETKFKAKGLKVLMLNGDTSVADKEKIYKLLEKKTIPYDVIMYSPTLTVGVSIFIEIKHHFHYDNSGTISVVDSIQMTRRVRNAKDLHFYIKGRSSYKTSSISKIERNLFNFKMYNEFGVCFGVTAPGKMLAEFKRTENILENSHKYAFRELLMLQFKKVKINSAKVEIKL